MESRYKGVVNVLFPDGEVVKVYDIKIETRMVIDPHSLAYSLRALIDRENDEWISLGAFFEYTEHQLFLLLQKFREGFNKSYYNKNNAITIDLGKVKNTVDYKS